MKKLMLFILVAVLAVGTLSARTADLEFMQVAGYDNPFKEWGKGFNVKKLSYSVEGRVGVKYFQTTFGIGLSPNSDFTWFKDPIYQLVMLNGFLTVGAKFDVGAVRIGLSAGERVQGCWTNKKIGFYDVDGNAIASSNFFDTLKRSDLILKANADIQLTKMTVGVEITSAPGVCFDGFGNRISQLKFADFADGTSVGVSFGHRY